MTTMVDALPRSGARPSAKYFYFYMSLSCAAVAFLGFAPTYWFPVASGTLKASLIVHLHGLLFFSWTLFFASQTWLAAAGRIISHRSLGMAGVSLATTMTIFGVLVTMNALSRAAALGFKDEAIAFAIIPLGGITFFAVVFTLAVAYVRRPETHKRLMLLAAISILDAAVARWFLTFLAPAGASGPPPVAVAIPPALVAYLLLVVAIVFDWRTRGRPHAVYVLGGAALVLMKLVSLPISASQPWQSFAGGLLALAQ